MIACISIRLWDALGAFPDVPHCSRALRKALGGLWGTSGMPLASSATILGRSGGASGVPLDRLRQALEGFGRLRPALQGSGTLWGALEGRWGASGGPLAGSGVLREALAGSGGLWGALGRSGTLWGFWAAPEGLWEPAGGSLERLWRPLGSFWGVSGRPPG